MIHEIDQVQPQWQRVERDRSLQQRKRRYTYLKNSESKSRDDDGSEANESGPEQSSARVDVRV